MRKPVYLDYNATTPLHPELLSFATESLTKFGNPSSVHWGGREAKKLLSMAREEFGKYFSIDPLEVVFTAGGSEANNLALKGVTAYLPENRREIVCSTVEHPSVMKTMEFLKGRGFKVRWLKVSRSGRIDLSELDGLLNAQTALVTVQAVNNETGNIFPIKEIADKAHAVGALVHSDMVQALGKIPLNLKELGVDLASFAGHKFYSLKGAGFLYVKRGVRVESLIHGGGQERSRRAGTENTPAIATFGQALRILGPRVTEVQTRLADLRDRMEKHILEALPDVSVNGATSLRVGNTSNLSIEGIDGETLLINMDTRGFAVSSGAACSSGSQEPSPVLTAMGLSAQQASQSLRISLGWLTTEEEINEFVTNLTSAVVQMREITAQSEERGVI
jgi:cysteine desulfurase